MSTLKVGEIKHENFTGTTQLKLDNSGRLLVGTTTEGHENADDLTIATSGTTGITLRSGTSGAGNIYFSDATSGNAEYDGYISYTQSVNKLQFGTNQNTRMAIDSSGRVGIGTNTPSNLLHCVTSDTTVARLESTASGGTGVELLLHHNSSSPADGDNIGAIYFQADDDAGNKSTFGVILVNAEDVSNGSEDGHMRFETASNGTVSERMRIDSSGNVGIGNTTPGSFHSSGENLVIGSGSGDEGMTVYSGAGSSGIINFADGTSGSDSYEGRILYRHADNAMSFHTTNGTERMRIDSIGRLLHGCTSATGGSSEGNITIEFPGNARNGIKTRDTTGSHSVNHMVLISGSTDIGQIIGSTSSVSYSSASDYRLKENVVAISDGISRLKLLKPSKFNFKVTPDETVDGFLAHEVMSIVPQAVSGIKDAVDSNGKPIHQSMDSAKLVPLLTAALQEAVGKIETLETKVAALEAA